MRESQKRIRTLPVIVEPIPGFSDVSIRLITRTASFHNVLPMYVDLLKNGMPCEGQSVSSLEELLRVTSDLWNKGIGEPPSQARLAVFVSKILTQIYPENSAEIPVEINRVIRSLPQISTRQMMRWLDFLEVNSPPKDLKARLIEMGSWIDWGFWETEMNYHVLDDFSACGPYHST